MAVTEMNEYTSFMESLIKEKTPLIDRAIKKYFPESVTAEFLEEMCGKATYEYDVEAASKGIHKVGWDLIARGGKRWRPLLMMMIIETLGGDPEQYIDFLIIPEIIHNGTLIIDDIEDRSLLRRGRDTIHRIYGVDLAINTGNAMYFIPLLALIKKRESLGTKKLLKIYETYAQEMINIAYGQGTDLWWHRGLGSDVTISKYHQMAAYKTGTIARMSAKIGAILCDADEELVESFGSFAENIAVAFQIQDDILNLREQVGKEFGEDIKEGKRSLIAIRALEKLPDDKALRLTEILDMQTDDIELIKEAVELIKETDAFKFSMATAETLIKNSWAKLNSHLPENEGKEKLRKLSNYLILRSR